MSIEYFVVTSSELPGRAGGWAFTVGPVTISEDAKPSRALTRAAKVASPRAVLNFASSALHAAHTLASALLVADALGGAVVDEDGPELVDSFPPVAEPPSAAQIEARLVARYERARDEQQTAAAQAAERFQARLAEDPMLASDNDWSDVSSAVTARPARPASRLRRR